MRLRDLDPSNGAWTGDVTKLCLEGPSIPKGLVAEETKTDMPDVRLDALCATIFAGFDTETGLVKPKVERD